MVGHTESRILVSDLLGKYGVLWYQLAAYIEDFYFHLITAMYGDNDSDSVRVECNNGLSHMEKSA